MCACHPTTLQVGGKFKSHAPIAPHAVARASRLASLLGTKGNSTSSDQWVYHLSPGTFLQETDFATAEDYIHDVKELLADIGVTLESVVTFKSLKYTLRLEVDMPVEKGCVMGDLWGVRADLEDEDSTFYQIITGSGKPLNGDAIHAFEALAVCSYVNTINDYINEPNSDVGVVDDESMGLNLFKIRIFQAIETWRNSDLKFWNSNQFTLRRQIMVG